MVGGIFHDGTRMHDDASCNRMYYLHDDMYNVITVVATCVTCHKLLLSHHILMKECSKIFNLVLMLKV